MRDCLARVALWWIARIVPAEQRARCVEEWRAEAAHGGWSMLPGAVPDALAMRRLTRRSHDVWGRC